MKALSIHQPWAELIVAHARELPLPFTPKRVENRRWATEYRGPLLIHATKSRRLLGPGTLATLPKIAFGAIVGVADLVDCVPFRNRVSVSGCEVTAQGKWDWLESDPYADGPWCWILENARRFATPIPYCGRQRLFDVPDSVVSDALGLASEARPPSKK